MYYVLMVVLAEIR